MRKRKRKKSSVLDIPITGTKLNIGALTVGSVAGAATGTTIAATSSTALAGISVAGAGMPAMGAAHVLRTLKKMGKKV